MAKYTMVFHGYLGSDKDPVSQEKDYNEYPVVPRIGEGLITGFGSLSQNSLWRVRDVRHMIRGTQPEGVIIDLVPGD
jgi:hypothetical protein